MLPRRLLRILLSLFHSIGDVQVDLGPAYEAIFFLGGNYMLATRRVVERFPAFEQAIPSCKQEIRASAPEMLAAANRLEDIDDHAIGRVCFTVQDQTLYPSVKTIGIPVS